MIKFEGSTGKRKHDTEEAAAETARINKTKTEETSDNAQRKLFASTDKQRQFQQGTAKTLCDRRRKPLSPRDHDSRLSKSQKGFHR